MLSQLSQFVFDALRSAHGRKKKIWERFRSFLIKMGDHNVSWELAGRPCILPLSHSLPYILNEHPQYSAAIPRLAHLLTKRMPGFSMIDVGANIGDTTLMVREVSDCPILSVEGDNRYFSLLQRNIQNLSNVSAVRALLGERQETISASLNTAAGTGSLQSCEKSKALEIRSLDMVLEEFPPFQNARLLKIDTDGYDLKILRGARSLLTNHQPILYFEFDPYFLKQTGEEPISAFEFLKDLGYETVIVYDNFGDLLLTTTVGEQSLWQQLCNYLGNRGGSFYFDLCIFPKSEDEIACEFIHEECSELKQRRSQD